jgi:hypothetical protein
VLITFHLRNMYEIDDECYEWVKTFIKDDALNKAFTTYGSEANKILRFIAKVHCVMKNRETYLQDAINLTLQDDFEDADKIAIFENILSQKEQEYNLYNDDTFVVPSDLEGRLELLRLVDVIVRGKIQSISDFKKVLSFLGVNQVEFHFTLDNYNEYNTVANSSYKLVHWGRTYFEEANTWKILLPQTLEVDTERRNRVESFMISQKQPHHNIEFLYTL